MATVQKKKETVKRAAKTAAKSAYGAATRSAKQTSDHAASWAKQGAKLYQLPFAQGDIGEAGKQAAEKMENMMRMGSDAMQQFWSNAQNAAQKPDATFAKFKAQAGDVFGHAIPKMPNIPHFNPAEMQEKMTKFSREAAEQLARSASSSNHAATEAMELSRENAEALVEITNIAVALLKEIGAEAISYANKSFSQNVEMSKEVLSCRTLNDMFDLSSRFMKSNLDSFFSQSVKFSEKLFQTATEVSEPLNERISESAERISKAMAA